MVKLYFNDQALPLQDDETVLAGLLRHGHKIANGCRAGACKSCLMIAESGDVPAAAQQGLSANQKQLGHFLSCLCRPLGSLSVRLPGTQNLHSTEVLSADRIGPHVLRLRLHAPFNYRSGQYLNIHHNGLVRSYSIASVPGLDPFIELHIKILPGGYFSYWAAEHLKPGDKLTLQGPMGTCFYSGENLTQSLLLAGIGTGLAPLYGILRDALHKGHKGSILLVLGGATPNSFYYRAELLALAQQYPQLTLTWVCLEPNLIDVKAFNNALLQRDIYQYLRSDIPSIQHHGIYLCGAESFVRKLKKQCFLAGANLSDIHADAFLPCSH